MIQETQSGLFAMPEGMDSFRLREGDLFQTHAYPWERPDVHEKLQQVRDEERRHIARELHDQTIQELIALGFKLATIEKRKEPTLRDEIKSVRGDLAQVIQQLRATIGHLRAPEEETGGFQEALEAVLGRLKHYPTAPEVQFDLALDVDTLPKLQRQCLMRVIQESLQNIAKHASAKKAWLKLHHQGNQVVLEVHDNGCGFQLPDSLNALKQRQCFGLIGISEQVETLGGSFSMHSSLGSGTTLTVHLPLLLPLNNNIYV